jgi:beta-lactamase regulating signal transducer with metallopeptidase domain
VLELLAAVAELLLVESLYAALVFAVVLALSRVLRRRGPTLHLALWSLVFVRLLLPPGLSHPLGLGAVADRLLPAGGGLMSIDAAAGAGIGALASAAAQPQHGPAAAGKVPWTSMLGASWLVGLTFVAAAYARRRRAVRRTMAAASPFDDPLVRSLAESWRTRLNVRRPVRVVTSKKNFAPFTDGVLRPRIYLPAEVAADRRRLEPVIAHEMAHVARLDALWLGVQNLVQLLYFFHPLVWISGARLNFERERLCDATVLSAGRIAPRAYAASLVGVLRLALPSAGALPMTEPSRRITVRIAHILDPECRRPRLAGGVAAAAALGFFVLPLAGGGAALPVSDLVPTPETLQGSAEGPVAHLDTPVPGGRVTWAWGPGRDPFNGTEVFHRGVDVAAAAGTPVLAPADGTVTVAAESYDPSPASGTVIIIDHEDGLSTFYSHLGTLEVREGQRVARGELIAGVGSTGRSTGPHVHFEVLRNGERVDPADYVDQLRK